MADCFSQLDHRVRMDWGRRGCATAAARGDVIVIVDVLRFSTAVIVAASRGVSIYPASDEHEVSEAKLRHDAIVIENGLAPASYEALKPGARVALWSPNGATCVQLSQRSPRVMIGALINATAVARMLMSTADPVTVIACGERWRKCDDEGSLRFAIEDYLGAGAILSRIDAADRSPEAEVCAAAFEVARPRLRELVMRCDSGLELLECGDSASVELAAQLDRFDMVPELQNDGRLQA